MRFTQCSFLSRRQFLGKERQRKLNSLAVHLHWLLTVRMTKQKRPVSRETKPECTMSEIKSLVTLHRKTVQLQVSKGEECFDHDISVVTYNILADFYLQSTLAKGGHKTCSRENVTLNYCKDSPRHKLLLREVRTIHRYYRFLPVLSYLLLAYHADRRSGRKRKYRSGSPNRPIRIVDIFCLYM